MISSPPNQTNSGCWLLLLHTALATAAAAAASPVQAVVRMASHYMTTSGSTSSTSSRSSSNSGHTGGVAGLLVSGTFLGRGLDHLIRAASHAAAATGSSSSSSSSSKDLASDGALSSLSMDADLLAALLVFALAALCDALDGRAARAYNQCSSLGVVLDVVADNVLRSCLWMSAALLDARCALPALGFVSCEWLTLLASQVRAWVRCCWVGHHLSFLRLAHNNTARTNQNNNGKPTGRLSQRGWRPLEAAAGRGPVARPPVLQQGVPVRKEEENQGVCGVLRFLPFTHEFIGMGMYTLMRSYLFPPRPTNHFARPRNPLGVLGIGGLFLAPLWPLLRHSLPAWLLLPITDNTRTTTTAADLSKRIVRTVFDWMGWVVLGGRIVSLVIEVYFISGLVRMLCDEDGGDDEQRHQREGSGGGGGGDGHRHGATKKAL
jgi:hypothetical protein